MGVSCSSSSSSRPLLFIGVGSWSKTVSCPSPEVDGFASTIPAAALDLCLCPRAGLFHTSPQKQRQFVSIPPCGEWIFACSLKVRGFDFASHEGRFWGSRQSPSLPPLPPQPPSTSYPPVPPRESLSGLLTYVNISHEHLWRKLVSDTLAHIVL